jgi:hypothetical protein
LSHRQSSHFFSSDREMSSKLKNNYLDSSYFTTLPCALLSSKLCQPILLFANLVCWRHVPVSDAEDPNFPSNIRCRTDPKNGNQSGNLSIPEKRVINLMKEVQAVCSRVYWAGSWLIKIHRVKLPDPSPPQAIRMKGLSGYFRQLHRARPWRSIRASWTIGCHTLGLMDSLGIISHTI